MCSVTNIDVVTHYKSCKHTGRINMYLSLYYIITIIYLYRIKPTAAYDVKYLQSENYKTFEYTNITFTHAESPVWDPDSSMLYWVDVINQDVHALHYYTKKHKVKHINYGEVNIVIPIQNSSRLLLGVRNELFLMDWNKPGDSALRFLAAFDLGSPDNILNEGKADALGRFWGGTKGRQKGNVVMHDEGALYSIIAPDFTPRVQLKPVSISNGLVWSLNNTIMYYIDSLSRKIEAFDFDLVKGRISKRRTILEIDDYWDEEVIADGMTIDKDGFLWIALMFHGCIARIDPDKKEIVERYKLPVTLTTSLTWGGPNFGDLIVTTSRRNLEPDKLKDQPLAGAVFVLHHMGTSGVPNHKFVFDNADEY
nr:regucalcin-like [Helicoverpa armigera]